MSASLVRAVLFDLDGTLIDSAPDLAGAANEMLAVIDPFSARMFRAAIDGGATVRVLVVPEIDIDMIALARHVLKGGAATLIEGEPC